MSQASAKGFFMRFLDALMQDAYVLTVVELKSDIRKSGLRGGNWISVIDNWVGVDKNFCKPRCIDWYLHWLIV